MRTLLVFPLAALAALGQASFFDDFNRADGSDLGPNWQLIGGTSTRVIGNEAGNIAASATLSLVQSSLFSAAYSVQRISADIRTTDTATTTQYVALALGHNGVNATANGIYVKIQRQSGSVNGAFNFMGIYTGINSSNSNSITGGATFFALDQQVTAARMTIWCPDPTTISVGLDHDFNGTFEQVYSRTINLGGITLGNQAGLGVFGTAARMDNFNAVPEPATLAALGIGLALIARRRTRRKA